jgi:hypothetical protein
VVRVNALSLPSSVLGIIAWLAILSFLLTGMVLFMLALIRWNTGSWKYLLLALVVVSFPLTGIAGWVLLFTGGYRRARSQTAAAMPPPPQTPPSLTADQ